ncbi:cupin domain-containing protein [Hyphomicrobium sp. ghe19]|uniref:cupin domain-containing protein n=1 Tax=Hyphomicrobium sp. ghe19 TaxID=2682968 RepID=UPI001366CF2A|nr:Ethanolamine utilization protein EutQ [Hyphomicrobium sp. ghe19]
MLDRKRLGFLAGAGLFAIVAAASAYGEAKAPSKELTYIKNAQGMQIKSMGTPNVDAFLQDIISSDDPKAPLTCGLFRLEKSAPLTYDYTYDEAKIILEGSMTVSDGKNTVTATKGDVLFFPKGSTITFTTEKEGLGFICGQRARDNS